MAAVAVMAAIAVVDEEKEAAAAALVAAEADFGVDRVVASVATFEADASVEITLAAAAAWTTSAARYAVALVAHWDWAARLLALSARKTNLLTRAWASRSWKPAHRRV